jgi:3-oxoadipate enol-lactonase
MPVAAVNGIEMRYADSGGEGPGVVFSHWFLLDHTMFGRQVTALTPQYRVITWDQRGHGGTPGDRSVHLLGFGGRPARAARPARC